MSLRRHIREALKQQLPRLQALTERAHVRIEPLHYYSNIADRRWLRANRPLWQQPFAARGLHWDLDEQLTWLAEVTAPFEAEVHGLAAFRDITSRDFGPGFGPIESQVLHGVVRSQQPARIIEVGSGVSTAIAHAAGRRNEETGGRAPRITCVEPFPHVSLRTLPGVEVIEAPCQAVDRAVFEPLAAGDVLFIDSTHAVRTGSELPFLYLDLLPSLPPGVLVHIHDIYLPYLFSPTVLGDVFDWQETVLLVALLTGNDALRIDCCLSALHHDRSAELARLLPDYRPVPTVDGIVEGGLGDRHLPASTWLRTVGEASA